MNVSVLGWYGHGNTGDEAFKLAFPRLLSQTDVVTFVEWIAEGDDPDALILGGGDVVYPSFTRFLSRLPGKPKIAASVSLTETSDWEAFGLLDHVYVRDMRSLALAQEMGHGDRTSYLPDVTLILEPDPVAGHEWLREAFESRGLELYEKVVIVVMSSYVAFNNNAALARDVMTFMNTAGNIADAADNTQASFVFLPFSNTPPNDDRIGNGMVAGRCKFYAKNYWVTQDLDVQTTLNVLSCSHAVVSTRLHSTIFSVLSGVPFVDLTHHTKNLGFIETIDRTHWSIPFWDFSPSNFKGLVHSFVGGVVPDQSLKGIVEGARAELGKVNFF